MLIIVDRTLNTIISSNKCIDDIIRLELSFLLETLNDVFNSILMYMYVDHNCLYPLVN